ncbi:MAG TPA: hypothetical protein VFM55_03895 [Micromonosporaceae bacterium]|nr:hypothetical protein [Micromonosporaceae bacterium]
MTPPRTSRTLSAPEQIVLLDQLQRMTPQARAILAPDDVVPRSFMRDPEELVDPSGVALRSGFLQNAFEARRQAFPDMSTEEFLAGAEPGTLLYGVVDALLGPASATLLRTTDPDRYVDALRLAYADFRTTPPPFDGGVSYGSYRYHVGNHVALPETLNVTPMNAPVGPDLHYPPYGGIVTARGHRSIGTVMGSQALGREIPLDLRGPDLFRELQVRSVDEVHAWDYDPDFLLSEVQIAHMISTGEPPMYRFSLVSGPPRPRAVQQARWELAARLGDERVLTADGAALQRIWDRAGRDAGRPTGSPLDLRSRYGRDPYYRLSRDELFEMAMGRGSLDVAFRPYEWEHARPQRFIREMQLWVRRLMRNSPDEDFWSSRLSMLTGASEPANLQLLTPFDHARTDVVAARMFGGMTRLDRFGNRAVPTLDEVSAYDTMNRYAAFPSRSAFPLWSFPLTDELRATEPLVAFDQRTLAELIAALMDDDWQRAVVALDDDLSDQWKRLVARVNTQAGFLGLPTALRLPD